MFTGSPLSSRPERSVVERLSDLSRVNSWKRRQQAASENGERFPLSHEFGGVEAAC